MDIANSGDDQAAQCWFENPPTKRIGQLKYNGLLALITDPHLHSALRPIIRAAVVYLLSILAIAAVLIAGKYLVDGVRGAVSARDRLQVIAGVREEVERYRQDRAHALDTRMGDARQLTLTALDTRIRTVTQQLASTNGNASGELSTLLGAGPQRYAEQLAARYRNDIERVLLQQELGYLQQVRAHLFALQSRTAAQAELKRLLETHRAVYAKLIVKRQEIAQLDWIESRRMQYAWARSPRLDRLAAEANALVAENNRAAAAYRAQRQALQRMQSVATVAAFSLDGRQLDQTLAPLQAELAEARMAVSGHWLARFVDPFKQALPLACGILLLALTGRAAIRAVFYFVLAPLATRAAPLRLAPGSEISQTGQGGEQPDKVALLSPSAVSQALRLAPDEELLVLPPFLQSAPVGAARGTRWLVKGRPWASLTSGMAMLTCVRTRQRDDQVVLSASDDGLSEIALLRVPAGQALAIQPRALVGLVADARGPVDIRWQWRLASLHAWLTLQLRFFVIRGPLVLAVQGQRGVRVQSAQATQAIRQTATLGFSTDVAYSTVRSEPFLPYLRGQAPLLNDRFGGAGVYLYDETPGGANRPGRVGRGLEGLTDALLKLFGY